MTVGLEFGPEFGYILYSTVQYTSGVFSMNNKKRCMGFVFLDDCSELFIPEIV